MLEHGPKAMIVEAVGIDTSCDVRNWMPSHSSKQLNDSQLFKAVPLQEMVKVRIVN
jgi:hypothetical protein